MSQSSYLTQTDLRRMGLASIGRDVRVSRDARIYGADRVTLADHVRIDDFVVITADEPVNIGSWVHVAAFCGLFGRAGITMEDFSTLSSRVVLYSTSDDYSGATLTNPTVPDRYKSVEAGRVHVGRHAIVGSGSILLPHVTLGEGAAVGALSLVKKSLSAWTIAAGVPAREIGKRSTELLRLERDFLAETR